MKKHLSILLVVIAVTAIYTSTAFAAPINGKSVSLLSVEYQKGGIVLKFETSGLTQADLKEATFFAASNYQDIFCDFMDDTPVVRCTVAKSLADMGDFKVTLAGFTFWGELPKERSFGLTCGKGNVPWYIANSYYYGEFANSFDVPVWIWDEHKAEGGFEIDAQYGWTYEIIGTFCAPDWETLPE